MMDLVPVLTDGIVILNALNVCASGQSGCRSCPELTIGIHNWIVENELKYFVIDLQDEKDVCPTFLIELMQLRKRFRIPFIFAGIMARPKATIESYAASYYPNFASPEEAANYLRKHHGALLKVPLMSAHLKFNEPLPFSRAVKPKVEGPEVVEEVEAED